MTKRKTSTAAPETVAPPEGHTDINTALFSAVAKTMETGTRAWCDWQEEMSRFVATRVEADLKLQRALVACRDLGEVAAIQQEWASATARHFLDGMTRLSRFPSSLDSGTAASHQASTPISPEARHAAE